jgi:hypothetical protein
LRARTCNGIRNELTMNDIHRAHRASRRQFITNSGVIIVASAFARAGLFAEEPKKEEEEVSPAEDLMREHGVLKRLLLVYGEAIRRIEATRIYRRKL